MTRMALNGNFKSCRNCNRLRNDMHCEACRDFDMWLPMPVPKTDYTSYSNKSVLHLPRIKKVLFRHPATIVFWDDNTKTVVKCSENDYFDCEKGLAMAIAKKFFGNEGNYYNEFKKWLPEEEIDLDPVTLSFTTAREVLERLSEALKNSYGEANEVIVEGE